MSDIYAFPLRVSTNDVERGMFLLDYYAAYSLMGRRSIEYSTVTSPADIAKACYDDAAAMIAHRATIITP